MWTDAGGGGGAGTQVREGVAFEELRGAGGWGRAAGVEGDAPEAIMDCHAVTVRSKLLCGPRIKNFEAAAAAAAAEAAAAEAAAAELILASARSVSNSAPTIC